MIDVSPCTVLKTDYSNESTNALISNLQKAYAETSKSTVIITDITGNFVTQGHILAPYKKHTDDTGKLWKCCKSTIKSICQKKDTDTVQEQMICECGHEVTSTKIRLIGDDIIRIFTLRVTDSVDCHDLIIKKAIENGYTVDEAAGAYGDTSISESEKSTYTHEVLRQQAELFNTLLISSIVTNHEKEIEERNLTEKALIKAKEDAEESSRLKSSLLANMSHELRTPMTGILGFSEILVEELEEPRLKNMASTIYKSATRLMTTLNSIMDLSAIESNKTTLSLKPVNIKNTILSLLKKCVPDCQ